MVNLGYQRDANEAFAFGAGQGVPMEVQHVQREALWMHSHEWQVPWLLPRQPQEQLQQQHDQPELYDPQQQLLFPQFGYWQQQHQRQFLREQLDQQQSLLLQQEPQRVVLDQERQQALHQYDQQQPLQTQARLKRKRKEAGEKQHADPRLGQEEQQQQLQLSDPLSDQWLAEEWIEPESSVSEMPQPSIPQQGSQYFAPAPEPCLRCLSQVSLNRGRSILLLHQNQVHRGLINSASVGFWDYLQPLLPHLMTCLLQRLQGEKLQKLPLQRLQQRAQQPLRLELVRPLRHEWQLKEGPSAWKHRP
ncbi:LOW QUALITY PROTEIN: uncharacterized protein EMH_0087560 [Eimeria mitis]|uniref:Uncharacterized protein n=1 Tax=Eimeria mitis TaxID=44415 RepID=U6KJQ9_9EIME|nr:LOW QUALITY PROTEIN: uncharacterized protein EMH_0087560 [Eimeria mitis]CDJ36492.1 hypothetical protein EMH_0087560 [Eimeria mitis]